MCSKYTPLEEQFLTIKSEHADAVLFIQCGYKYKLFDEDARIASRVLQIGCFPDHNFVTASIPVPRLHVHLSRLVAAGYKVGVVKQVETTAIKASSVNKSGLFTRTLAGLYTRSTLIGPDVNDPSGEETDANPSKINDLYLLCIHMSNLSSKRSPKQATTRPIIGFMAVQPSTGLVVYEEFKDSIPIFNELYSRLAYIRPAEILYPEGSPECFRSAIEDWEDTSDPVRRERIPAEWFESSKAFTKVARFYSEECNDVIVHSGIEQSVFVAQALQVATNLPQSVICCFNALIEYLRPFHLLRMFYNFSNFQPFQSDFNYLKMNQATINNLEIFTNHIDRTEKSSLFQLINYTNTLFGKRKLKQWLSFPLKDVEHITRRQEAVKEFLTNYSNILVAVLKDMMHGLPDLENMLCSTFHKKCSPREFCYLVKSLAHVHSHLLAYDDMALQLFKSTILQEFFIQVPLVLESAQSFLENLSETAARNQDYAQVFSHPEQFPDLLAQKNIIADLENTLESYKDGFCDILGVSSLEYVSVCGLQYLVEVENDNLDAVPFDWIKINSTKQVTRFQPLSVCEGVRLLSQHKEQLHLCFSVAWDAFLNKFNAKYWKYKKAIELLASLDCVMSLAEVARVPGYICPHIVTEQVIEIDGGRHPIVDCVIGGQYIPNDTQLSTSGVHVMIVTGPNMGGKSCYTKQVALICLLAQIGSFVPAMNAKIGVLDGIYLRMGASDSILEGRSTFKRELEETADILRHANSSSLIIMDELGRGTSTYDGAAIAYATLKHIVEEVKCFTIFVTHYPLLTTMEKDYPKTVVNYHMSYIEDLQGSENQERIVFLYLLEREKAGGSYGINVAALAGLNEDILALAQRKSSLLQMNLTVIYDFINFFST